MYMLAKHLHLTAVFFSISLFVIRFFWLMRSSALMDKRWVKVFPHVIDTLLLISALSLCFMIQQYPVVNHWLSEKIVFVVLYIVLGMVALNNKHSKKMQWIAFVGAISCVLSIANIALFKQPILFS